jgi:NAD-dependent dihydropyrimidine dehydrogenase PreA subunit
MKALPYVITEACIDCKDGACVDACPVDCIYEGARMLYIHPDECVGCGACEWACPVEATYSEDDLPPKWRHYAAVNAEFTRALGSPLGAKGFGPVVDDHPTVKAVGCTP